MSSLRSPTSRIGSCFFFSFFFFRGSFISIRTICLQSVLHPGGLPSPEKLLVEMSRAARVLGAAPAEQGGYLLGLVHERGTSGLGQILEKAPGSRPGVQRR